MDINDFVFAQGKTGAGRIHRASCKRIPAGAVPLGKVLDFTPGTAAAGKAAGCCKPRVDELLADARAALAAAPVDADPQRKHFRPDVEDTSATQTASATYTGPTLPTSPMDPPETYSTDEPYEARVPHFASAKAYARVIATASVAIGARYEVTVTFDSKTLETVVTGDPMRVVEAADVIRAARQHAGAGLAAWKKADPKYRTYPKSEKWGREACWNAEVAYFTASIEGYRLGDATDII